MNKIETEITLVDIHAAKFYRNSPQKLAAEILEHLQNFPSYWTTFLYEIPMDARRRVELELQKKFELWANSWIAPKCREIIAKKLVNKKK